MSLTLKPTPEQRVVLERLHLPDRIAAALRLRRFALAPEDAEAVRDALTVEMATKGFGPDYEPTAEGRVIEDLIDRLFIA